MFWLDMYPRVQSYTLCVLSSLETGKSLLDSFENVGMDASFLFFKRLECIWKMFQKVAGVLQMISYRCVGILVIVVYQVLLMPLNMLYSM